MKIFNILHDTQYTGSTIHWVILGLIVISIIAYITVHSTKFRTLALKLMGYAENRIDIMNAVGDIIEYIDKNEWDERMIMVVAGLIKEVPILKLLPKHLVITFLRRYVQKLFDDTRLLVNNTVNIKKQKILDGRYNEIKHLLPDELLSNIVKEASDAGINLDEKSVAFITAKSLEYGLKNTHYRKPIQETNKPEEHSVEIEVDIVPKIHNEILEEVSDNEENIKKEFTKLFLRN